MSKADGDYSTSRNLGALDRFLRDRSANNDWHHLDPPEMNEAPDSYFTRAILHHPAVIAVTHFGRLDPLTALGRVRPAIMTLSHWGDGLAGDEAVVRKNPWWQVTNFDYDATHTVTSAFRPRIVQRLWVEFIARIVAGNWLMLGCFADDPKYQPRPVNPRLLQNPAMWLDPRGGLFGPDESGKGPDIGCLTVRAREVAKNEVAVAKALAAEREMTTHLAALMKAKPNVPIPKELARSRATREAHLRPISGRAFDRAWAAALRESGAMKWASGGRRKSPQ
jgi:hypothetical protein